MQDECADGSPGFVGALQPSGFVGRQSETEALNAALNRAIRFRAPQLVTVVGPLGETKEAEGTAGTAGRSASRRCRD